MKDNVKRFLYSKDLIKLDYGLGLKIWCFIAYSIMPVIQIIFYLTNSTLLVKTITPIDFAVAIIIVAAMGVNLIAGIFLDKHKYFYLHYGIAMLSVSFYAIYYSFRLALYPFVAWWYIIIPIAFWIIASALQVIGIVGGIKHDRFISAAEEEDAPQELVLEKDKRRVSKSEIVQLIAYLAPFLIAFAIQVTINLVYSDLYASESFAGDWRLRILVSSFMLFMALLFLPHWKLILKQYYTCKFWTELSTGEEFSYMVYISSSEEETFLWAKDYAKTLHAGDTVLLDGEMGAGKTLIAKGIAAGLGIEEEVTSPTYAYVNTYGNLYHFDCYRIQSEEQAWNLGLADYFEAGGICLVEWSENIAGLLPENVKKLEIIKRGENAREIRY